MQTALTKVKYVKTPIHDSLRSGQAKQTAATQHCSPQHFQGAWTRRPGLDQCGHEVQSSKMCMKYVRISTLSPVHFTVTFTVHHQLVVVCTGASGACGAEVVCPVLCVEQYF
jgi:hypothetical protein